MTNIVKEFFIFLRKYLFRINRVCDLDMVFIFKEALNILAAAGIITFLAKILLLYVTYDHLRTIH